MPVIGGQPPVPVFVPRCPIGVHVVTVAGHDLRRPIAVFDAGIGSYSVVARLHDEHPDQDIVYLADRASFPYGAKTVAQLRVTIAETLEYLHGLGAAAIVVASNVPSVTVLADLIGRFDVPVFDVLPPVRVGLELADSGQVAILGVETLVASEQFADFVAKTAGDAAARVIARNASRLVELVETGVFLTDPVGVQRDVDAFMADLLATAPQVRVVTLSSTHLPWLHAFFERAAPGVTFIDPLHDVVGRIGPHVSSGSGTLIGLVTENAAYPSRQFLETAARLDIRLPFTVIDDFHR